MRLVLKLTLVVGLAAVAALVGVAIFSDLPAPQREVTLPIATQ